MIKLGEKVKDTVTAFEGTATARTEYLWGCPQVRVQPEGLKDGKPIEPQWIEEPRLTSAGAEKAIGFTPSK